MSRSSALTSATHPRPYAQARASGGRPRGRSGAGSGAGRPGGTNPARRLVSLAAAAEYADLSTRTLRRYISAGRLTGYRVGPRLIKIDLNELERLLRPIPTAHRPD